MYCVYLALRTRKVLCGRFYAPYIYIHFHSFIHHDDGHDDDDLLHKDNDLCASRLFHKPVPADKHSNTQHSKLKNKNKTKTTTKIVAK